MLGTHSDATLPKRRRTNGKSSKLSKMLAQIDPWEFLGFHCVSTPSEIGIFPPGVGLQQRLYPSAERKEALRALRRAGDRVGLVLALLHRIYEGSEAGLAVAQDWIAHAEHRDGVEADVDTLWHAISPPARDEDPLTTLSEMAEAKSSAIEIAPIERVPPEWDALIRQQPTEASKALNVRVDPVIGFPPFMADIDPATDAPPTHEVPCWVDDFGSSEGGYRAKARFTVVGLRMLCVLSRLYQGSDLGLNYFLNWYAQVDDETWDAVKARDGIWSAWDLMENKVGDIDPIAELKALGDLALHADEGTLEPHDFFGNKIIPEPALTRAMLPAVISDFAFDQAERLGVDPALVALPALTVCAAAITDSVRVQPLENDHTFTQPARLWTLAVADSAVGKTPAMECSVGVLDAVQQRWAREDKKAWAQYLRDVKAAKQQEADEPERPKLRRTVVDDFTMEKLGEVLADNLRGVLIFKDELAGLISGFDAYRNGGAGKDQAAALGLHNGGPRIVDRKKAGSSLVIPNWGASIVGGIQINKMRQLAPKLSDDGFIQRFTPFFATHTRRPQDRVPDRKAIAAFRTTVDRLADIPDLEGRDVVTMVPEAHKWRRKVDDLVDAARALPGYCGAFKQHLGKWRGLFARLVLTLHVLQSEPDGWGAFPPVPEATARMAHDLMVRFFFPSAVRFYSEFFSQKNDAAQHARWVAGWVLARKLNKVTVRDVRRAYRELKGDTQQIERTLRVLAQANWVVPASGAWDVNPLVHRRFAERAAQEARQRDETRRQIAEAAETLKTTYRHCRQIHPDSGSA